ncbi:MAG: hypothetical protein HY901_14995 [Deltaproteobacteria bacterium]|nr:hypothetical protein [Deltaproteobacteria bacterium]
MKTLTQALLTATLTLAAMGCGAQEGTPETSIAQSALNEPQPGDVLDMGSVVVSSSPNDSMLFADFQKDAPWDCSTEDIGPCELSRCPTAYGVGTPTNAGKITITGGLSALEMIPNESGTYDMQFLDRALFTPGTRVHIRAEGNPQGAPRFHVGLWTPPAFDLLAPTFPASPEEPPMSVARSAAIDVQWGGAALSYHRQGRIRTVIQTFPMDPSEDTYTLVCKFKPHQGAGQIPAEALSRLPAGPGIFTVDGATEISRNRRGWYLQTWAALAFTMMEPGATGGMIELE